MSASKLIKDTNIVHRFSDVDGERCIMLPSIEGFNHQPLVSLEEAVEPLASIVHHVKTKAHMAKKQAKNPSDDLTSDESASIALYTMEWEPYTHSLYYILNTVLRADDREQLKPWLLYLKLVLTALSRLQPIRLTVYRALKLDTKIELERYQEGKDVFWWGFASCTTNKNISQMAHYLNSRGTRTLFIIDCLQGKDIGPHSYNKNDQEVLLLPGTRFEVTRCDRQRDDLHKVYLKEVAAQSILLESLFVASADETSQDSTVSTDAQVTRRRSIQNFVRHSFHKTFNSN